MWTEDEVITQLIRSSRAFKRRALPWYDRLRPVVFTSSMQARFFDPNYKLEQHQRQQVRKYQAPAAARRGRGLDPYRYEALGPRQIRLLKLQPGAAADSLVCTLSVHDLAEAACRDFEALSYTWGDAAATDTLLIDGKALSITSNLAVALRQLRDEAAVRVLWADAVCVNQGDVAERGAQVPLMGDIYRQARSVVVWLGVATADSELAFRLLRQLHEAAAAVAHPSLDRGDSVIITKAEQAALGLPPDDAQNPAWRALDALFWRPWFTRVWIIQEIALARSAVVRCGADSLPWPVLTAAARFIDQYHLGDEYGLNMDVSRILLLDDTIRSRAFSPSVLRLMAASRRSLATNPADKVYAVLGLAAAADPVAARIVPDYAAAVQDVYCDVAEACLARSLDILSLVADAHWLGMDGLPSWAPNWSQIPRETSFLFGQPLVQEQAPAQASRDMACGVHVPASAQFLRDGGARILRLRGVLFDRVAAADEAFFTSKPGRFAGRRRWGKMSVRVMESETVRNMTDGLVAAALRIWEYTVLALKTYPTGEPVDRVLHHTFVAGADVSAAGGDLAACYAAFRYRHMQLPVEEARRDERVLENKAQREMAAAYHDAVTASAYSRRMFVTRGGYAGVGPRSLHVGDCVVLLCGGKTAYVLRPQKHKPPKKQKQKEGEATAATTTTTPEQQPRRYTFVGEAYVHGVMHGEGFSGGAVLEDFDII